MEVDDFLEHYGTRGMKWGIRRSSAQLGRASESSEKTNGKPPWQSAPSRAGSSGSSKPGRPNVAHDQIVFEALKAKAKTHGLTSLSNDEIRVLTNRAETLKKAYTTFPKPQTKKQKFARRTGRLVDDVLVNTGQQLLKDVVKFKGQTILIEKGKLPPRKEDKRKSDSDD